MNFYEYPSWMSSSLLLIGEAALICIAVFIAFLIGANLLHRWRKTPRRQRSWFELPPLD